MLRKRNTEYYSKIIAKELGVDTKQIHAILISFTKNICHVIKKGEDIQIKGFGAIAYHKKRYAKKLKERLKKLKTY